MAQNYRFVYQYTHLEDSTQTDSRQKEIMRLDVEGQNSYYYAYKGFKRDSLLQQAKKNYGNLANTYFKDFVEKKGQEVYFYTRLMSDFFKVKEDRPLDWKIVSDTAKVMGYPTQKATVDFAGRHWIAWFTREIPIPDGPYKFHGLPGIILKMEDTGNLHTFEAVAVEKLKRGFEVPTQAYMEISREKYRKLYQQYTADPFESLRKSGIDPNKISKVTVNGKQVNVQDFLKSGKLGFSPDPNPIELDL